MRGQSPANKNLLSTSDLPIHKSSKNNSFSANNSADTDVDGTLTIDKSGHFVADKLALLLFDYFFVDDSVNNMYASEDRMLKMVSTFSLVTIFIACLGLFGLSSFMIEKRKREIGIRKVLGASSSQIVLMVSRSFVLLIGIGFVLAIPISGFLMNKWLSNFAYSVEIGPAIYIVSLGLSMLVGWSAVSYKAFEAASVNPTATLKEE